MNNQQARIEALLREAYDDAALTGRVPLDLAVNLASEGYDLTNIERDFARISEDY